MKTKERFLNDQGLVLLAQLGCVKDARTQGERVANRRSHVNFIVV